jgi:phospholipid transport system substrate-binding protein
MPNRRTFLILTAASLLPVSARLVRPANAQAAIGQASTFVKGIGDRLVAVVNGAESTRDKRAKLTSIIDGAVDVDGVARFCLGRFWGKASADQQQRYTELFHQVLVNNITSKLGEYRGVRFSMGQARQREDRDVDVYTVVERPNNPPTNVKWIINNPASNPKIIDVEAEGTSLRLTQRQDYGSYLMRNNSDIDALIKAMKQQVAQAG